MQEILWFHIQFINVLSVIYKSAERKMNSQPAPGYYSHQDTQKKQKKKIRLLKLVILVLVIIISTLICSLWVLYVHLESVEDARLAGYQEFCCSSDNQTCLTLLCPSGKQRQVRGGLRKNYFILLRST